MLRDMCSSVAKILDLSPEFVWAFWLEIKEGEYYHPHWKTNKSNAPFVIINCKSIYSDEKLTEVLKHLKETLSNSLNCEEDKLLLGISKFNEKNLLVRNEIWDSKD